MAISSRAEKKYWWHRNRKVVERYVKEARSLIARKDQNDVISALNVIDSALALSPRFEPALELKARTLLLLRRFHDIADMLQDYIPSLRTATEEPSISLSSAMDEKLLSSPGSVEDSPESCRFPASCFSVSDLKKKLRSCGGKDEGYWRYFVLGQACCHLGLMEDAMTLLQSGKRLAAAARRRESGTLSEDNFSLSYVSDSTSPPEAFSHLLANVRLLLRRRAAAMAALEAGLNSEALHHFSKIVDKRGARAPQRFLADCYLNRAYAYKSLGRIAESIADCNRTLALDPVSTGALTIRAALFESIRAIPDCLHDLEHLKLLYNSLRYRTVKIQRFDPVAYTEIPEKLSSLSSKIQAMKSRVVKRTEVDNYNLLGLNGGCSKSELERAYLVLCLRHNPEKSLKFIERCEFSADSDLDSVKDRARMSCFLLFRLIQKGYVSLKSKIEEQEEQRRNSMNSRTQNAVFREVFCRDIAAVSNLLSQVTFNRPLPVKFEGLSC